MIFVTVGTQLPFDRLIAAVDRWAGARQRTDVLAQVGASAYQPQTIRTVASLSPAAFHETFTAASLIVAHAGLGTILSALEWGKPVIVMPRRAELQEHRNDHQLATADRFAGRQGVAVAMDEQDMASQLDAMDRISVGRRIESAASPALVDAVRAFIAGRQPQPGMTSASSVR